LFVSLYTSGILQHVLDLRSVPHVMLGTSISLVPSVMLGTSISQTYKAKYHYTVFLPSYVGQV